MTKFTTTEELKQIVFGPMPECHDRKAGKNIAFNLVASVIYTSEHILRGQMTPDSNVLPALQLAFDQSAKSYDQVLTPTTCKAIEEGLQQFQARYKPVLEMLKARAS
ncbi:MAG: hypothetical protein DI551_06450 [Micavibrio aeruginosavorus]|uniref:Uncharacterized protein n=1 Tax=Micavibrio aeruginosavorus TaxID=349221 RepID=A0A2W5N4U6_9BACT|nr:MAG: hypothetical protein DI551_06450 [Micavibrio aeruginosavorus]